MTNKARVVGVFIAVRYLQRWRSRAAIERHQRRRLRRHLGFLRQNSPYFAGLLDSDDPAQLSRLPLMDKSVMMENFDRLNTVGLSRDEALALAIDGERSRDFERDLAGCSVGLSSGTTGHRGLFVVSPRERDAWAGTVLALTLPRGRKVWGHRIALFLRADNTLYESVNSNAVSFEFFDIYADMARNVERLAAYDPTILVGPPSVLRAVARRAHETGVSVVPERLISVAEVLGDLDRDALMKDFGVDMVHQLYQCTEGFLGHTCERGVLHLNEGIAIIEREYIVERRFVPTVTDLERRAQPIVRYRLNDILVERAAPCECGSALLALDRIEGREDDTLRFTKADGTEVEVFADMVTRAMVYAEGFGEYRVIQDGPDHLTVEIDVNDASTRASVRKELGTLCGALGCVIPTIEFGAYRTDLTKKLRRVQRGRGHHESM